MVLGLLSIKTISFLVFCVFAIAGLGYLLGRITIKGVSLGTAGVFIVALLFGALLYNPLAEQLKVSEDIAFINKILIDNPKIGICSECKYYIRTPKESKALLNVLPNSKDFNSSPQFGHLCSFPS